MGGFSIVPLAQKARTQTLIVDSDLNLGNYDLLCTDAKGDTAEFDEFVGGVGNFTNVLGSGNLDIEGTAAIKGNTQIDGNIVLEGAINNVNIADNGEITTSQGVNADNFNGANIKGVYTVTPSNVLTPNLSNSVPMNYLLPYSPFKYTGSVKMYNGTSSASNIEYIRVGTDNAVKTVSVPAQGSVNISFTNISALIVYTSQRLVRPYIPIFS